MAISVLKCALDRIIECVQHDEQKDNLWGFVVSLSRDERSVIGFVLADKEIADAQKANQYLPLGLQIAGLFSVGDKSPPSSTGSSGGMLSARLRPDRTDKQCVEFTRLNAPCDTVLLDRIPFIASCCLYRSTLERSIVVTDAIVRHGASHPAFALPEITKVCFDKPEALVDISEDQKLASVVVKRSDPKQKANVAKPKAGKDDRDWTVVDAHVLPLRSLPASQIVAPSISVEAVSNAWTVNVHADVLALNETLTVESMPTLAKDIITALQKQFSTLIALACREILQRTADASLKDVRSVSVQALHYLLPSGHPITLCVPVRPSYLDEDEASLLPLRQSLHRSFLLPMDRPLLRSTNALVLPKVGPAVAQSVSAESQDGLSLLNQSSKLRNPHLSIKPSGLAGAKTFLVDGSYVYFHYMQDKFNDKGWGCAYRTLQTLCSWMVLQQYSTRPVPSHLDIQNALIELKDKPSAFRGSSQWIGAIEVGLVLKHLYGITSKTMFVTSGSEVVNHARELSLHFQTQGTPVMIGGGELAYGLLGVDYNESTGDVRFLILDPHYTGGEDLDTIVRQGWCGWKSSDLFLRHAFYNFCLPQRPRKI